jgi:hypothetical protein
VPDIEGFRKRAVKTIADEGIALQFSEFGPLKNGTLNEAYFAPPSTITF